jgi:hypothetical protein
MQRTVRSSVRPRAAIRASGFERLFHGVAPGGAVIPRLLLYGWGVVLPAAVIPFAGEVILIAAALYALRGPRQTVEALLVLALTIMINKALVPVDISVLRWVVLFAAAARTLWDGVITGMPVPRAFWWLATLVVTLVLFAVTVSWLPTVSLFKSVSFFLGVGTALVALHRTRHLADYWQSLLLTLSVFVILGSIPLYYLKVYGFARNGVGFQGLLTHPQTYGPITAVLTAYVTGLVVFDRKRSWILLLTMMAGWGGVYYSQSRTGMLALVLSGVLVGGLALFKPRTWLPRFRQAMTLPTLTVGVLALGAFGVLYGPRLSEGLVSFLLKDEAAQDITSALEESRSVLVERSMENFRAAPLTGIGLGVPSDLENATIEYGPLGVPISASVEKGFQPAAVLEETGIVGAALLVLFLIVLLAPVVRRGTMPLAWMTFAVLLVNMGEAILFAIGGNGLFVWILLSMVYVITETEDAEGQPVSTSRRRQS